MVKTNRLYKGTYNQCLDFIAEGRDGDMLPSEIDLAARFQTSRTTIRAVLTRLSEVGIVDWQGRSKRILRIPKRGDYYQAPETRSASDALEPVFMRWLVSGGPTPGALLNESELARRFDVSTSAMREFLQHFSRFGVIEKRPNRHWVLKGFTREFAIELSDVRELFEERAVGIFLELPETAPEWKGLEQLRLEHEDMKSRSAANYTDFPEMDERFHAFLNSVSKNRFITGFHDIISLIFHYHYRWDKRDERARMEVAVSEHLRLIHALQARNRNEALAACRDHLKTARRTFQESIAWDVAESLEPHLD